MEKGAFQGLTNACTFKWYMHPPLASYTPIIQIFPAISMPFWSTFRKIIMLEKINIYIRFSSCYHVKKPSELANMLGVERQVVNHWKSGASPVPWRRLKQLVDEQGLTWDWLLEGREPKHREGVEGVPKKSFQRRGINKRFLSLFPGYSQAKLGRELGVNQTTVFKWQHNLAQVPWERLKDAVDAKGVTWEWLIEGR